jgi:hypothetical protein
MKHHPVMTRRRAIAVWALAAIALLVGSGLITAAVLAHAPAVVLPFVIVTGIATPMAMTWELPAARAALRDHTHAIATLRRQLDRLPEAPHPLDG